MITPEQAKAVADMKKDCTGIPITALCMIPRMNRICNENGYALTVHGSLARDYDFIAVPWTEVATDPATLLVAITKGMNGYLPTTFDAGQDKLHGRRAYVIQFGHGQWLDLSIMPRFAVKEEIDDGKINSSTSDTNRAGDPDSGWDD